MVIYPGEPGLASCHMTHDTAFVDVDKSYLVTLGMFQPVFKSYLVTLGMFQPVFKSYLITLGMFHPVFKSYLVTPGMFHPVFKSYLVILGMFHPVFKSYLITLGMFHPVFKSYLVTLGMFHPVFVNSNNFSGSALAEVCSLLNANLVFCMFYNCNTQQIYIHCCHLHSLSRSCILLSSLGSHQLFSVPAK